MKVRCVLTHLVVCMTRPGSKPGTFNLRKDRPTHSIMSDAKAFFNALLGWQDGPIHKIQITAAIVRD